MNVPVYWCLGAVLVLSGRAWAQDANPYGGAAGYLYSQGRVAAPGQVGITARSPAPDAEPAPQPSNAASDPAEKAVPSVHGRQHRRSRGGLRHGARPRS